MKIEKIKLLVPLLLFNILITTCQKESDNINNTGKNWKKASDSADFSPRAMHQVIVFKNSLILIDGNEETGNTKDVWRSQDAIHWTCIEKLPIDYAGHAVVFKDSIWLNANEEIWNSPDGIIWKKITTVTQFPKYGKAMLAYKNKLWVTGGWENGFRNDVWSSTDGRNWSRLTTATCFSVRANHSFVEFNNKMWIIAGQSGENKNDVWSSDDGINWISGKADFPVRHVTQVVSFKNKLWLFGGFGTSTTNNPILLSDVWTSTNGNSWTLVSDSAPFGKRMEHAAISFKNKIWIIGGQCGEYPNLKRKNDIWFTE